MLSVPEIVEKIIKDTPFLEEAIAKELINLSALARYIQPEIEDSLTKKISVGSIVMALKRLMPRVNNFDYSALRLLADLSDITIKSNLIEYTFANSKSLIRCQRELLNEIKNTENRFMTISHGTFETTLITKIENKESVENIFKDENKIFTRSDLSSLSIKLPYKNVNVPGVYYIILRQLAWHGINVIDVVSTTNEITIILDGDDIDEAFSVIKKLGK